MSTPITIEEFARRLKAMPRRLRDEIRAEARNLARDGERNAKRRAAAQFRHRTGRLVRSIKAALRFTPDGVTVALSAQNTRRGAPVQEARRPFLAPARDQMTKDLPTLLGRSLERALTRRVA